MRCSVTRQPGCLTHGDRGEFWSLLKQVLGADTAQPGSVRAQILAFPETFHNRRPLRKHRVLGSYAACAGHVETRGDQRERGSLPDTG